MEKKLWSRAFIAIVASNVLVASAFYALMPTLPMYLTESLKVDRGSIGLVMAAFSISAILVRPFTGHLIDNYHRFMVFILSLFFVTVTYGCYLFVNSVFAMFVLRLVQGAIFGLCTSAGATIVADIIPVTRRGEGIGIFALSIPVGMTAGPFIGLQLLRDRGAHVMFLAILLISLVSLVIAFWAKIPYKKAIKKKFSFARLFHRKALPISISMFFIMVAYGAIIVFVSIYASQKGFANVTTFFLCFSSAVFVSRLFLGRLFDKGYIFQLIVTGVALAAVSMVWLGTATSPTQFLIAGMIGGLGFGTLMPTCQATVNNLVESHESGLANSTYLISYDLGLGVGAVVIGYLADRVSLGEVYIYCALLVAASGAIFVLKAIPHYHAHKLRT